MFGFGKVKVPSSVIRDVQRVGQAYDKAVADNNTKIVLDFSADFYNHVMNRELPDDTGATPKQILDESLPYFKKHAFTGELNTSAMIFIAVAYQLARRIDDEAALTKLDQACETLRESAVILKDMGN